MNRLVLSSMLLSGAVVACDEGAPESEYTGPAIEIAVAPLNLPTITNAAYDIEVKSRTGAAGSATRQTVWKKGNPAVTLLGASQVLSNGPTDALNFGAPDSDTVTASSYGNTAGGDISYIGPCAATAEDDTDARAGIQNDVFVWIDGIYRAGVSPEPGVVDVGEWRDPCNVDGANAGCKLIVNCSENSDTFVEFNFTIMRSANQGFFDVAVNFEDIFCSAKFDSQYTGGTDITLLHGANNNRQHTAVAALACTHGASTNSTAVDTKLWIQNPTVTCRTGTAVDGAIEGQFTLNLALDEGNRLADDTVAPVGPQLRYAIYKGSETLNDSTTGFPLNKRYWNFAINLGALAEGYPGATCRLEQYDATARVATAAFPNWAEGTFTSWPFVRVVQTTLTTPDLTPGVGTDVGVTAKFRHALNGATTNTSPAPSNVTTFYAESTLPTGVSFPN